MSIRCAGECIVVVSCNLDSFVPFDGFVTLLDLFHCSFQEVMHVFDVTVCSGVSGT